MAGFLMETRPLRYCDRCGDRIYATDDGRHICLRCSLGEHLALVPHRADTGTERPGRIYSQRGERCSSPTPIPGWFPRATVAGFAASAVMLVGFTLAYGLVAFLVAVLPAEPRGMDVLRGWLFALTHNAVLDIGLSSLHVVIGIYFVGGLGWAVLYGGLVEPHLPGPAWARGVIFALAPAAVSLLVVVPALGGGFLGLGLGAGPLAVVGNLLLHALYGTTLGLVYGPLGELSVESLRPSPGMDLGGMDAAERATAGAILVGLLIGTVVGALIFVLVGGLQDEPKVLGAPPSLLALAALVGGAVTGAAIGPFIGMPGDPEKRS